MIPGCAKDAPPPPPPPPVVDLSRFRCPDLPAADVAAFSARVARPKPDTTGPDGRPWVSAGALQAGVDARDLVIARMARAGAATVEAYQRCQNGAPAKPDTSRGPAIDADIARRVAAL